MKIKEIDIFCKVIDNYGDAGFCLRLARDISAKNIIANLYCDDLKVVNQITSSEDNVNDKLNIQDWPQKDYIPGDIIIETFCCNLSESILDIIRQRKLKVIIIDYLSAESWVETYHSVQTYSDNIEGWYFYTGFSKKTGGLIVEDSFKSKFLKRRKQKIFQFLFLLIPAIISCLS